MLTNLQTVDYGDGEIPNAAEVAVETQGDLEHDSPFRVSKRAQRDDDNDTDFQADSDFESNGEEEMEGAVDPAELETGAQQKVTSKLAKSSGKTQSSKQTPTKSRKRQKEHTEQVSTPPKQWASTSKKHKRAASTTKKVKKPLTPSSTPDSKKSRKSSIKMQKSVVSSSTTVIDLTGDGDDVPNVTNQKPLTPPPEAQQLTADKKI